MDSGTSHLMEMLRERVTKLSTEGKWEEAMKSSLTLVDKARELLAGGDMESLLKLSEALETRGDILRQCGYLEDARICYLESLEMLNGRIEFTESMARISASIGVLYDSVENDEQSITFYLRAVELYERLGSDFLGEVADICNNLGFVYRSLGHFDEAEKLFLRGLEICHTKYGSEHEKTATICNNVGALYLATNRDESAREMHTMALDARLISLGKNHPDTAQSYSNLALALVQTGDVAKAKDCFQKSMDIFEKNIKTEAFEYQTVTENFVELLRQLGEEKVAFNLLKKSKKKLKKVAM
jgi:tetratricopeptide (TPR) repeat protein